MRCSELLRASRHMLPLTLAPRRLRPRMCRATLRGR